jgi:dipeptidyl-peptidase III
VFSKIIIFLCKMSAKDQFILPNHQPISYLDCDSSFASLSEKERLYLHYFSKVIFFSLSLDSSLDLFYKFYYLYKTFIYFCYYLLQASWYGGLISFVQSSPEAPLIFSLFHRIIVAEPVDALKKSVLDQGVTEDEFTAFLVYICGFLANAGNYKGMGDSKIIPNLEESQFGKIVRASKAYAVDPKVKSLYEQTKTSIFELNDLCKNLGLKGEGVTTYFSSNCTRADADLVGEWMKTKQIEAYICRTFKIVEADGTVVYDIKLASVETGEKVGITFGDDEFEGCKFRVTRGDYSQLLRLVVDNLEKVKVYAANENQRFKIQTRLYL